MQPIEMSRNQSIIERRLIGSLHFLSQESAEKAYYRTLAWSLDRGREVNKLSQRVGRQRQRIREMQRAADDFAHGLVSASYLAEALGVRDKRAFRAALGSSTWSRMENRLEGVTGIE